MINTTIWDEKYRPLTFDDYIGNDSSMIVKLKKMSSSKEEMRHILLHGPSGTGKTALKDIIIRRLDCDVLPINASDENNVETIRNKITNFVQTISVGNKIKIVVLEEGDHLTPQAQAILRVVMEKYIAHTKFILTCNYYDKIIPAIKSRFKKGTFEIKTLPKLQIASHLHGILNKENIKHDMKDVATIINNEYPDIRSMLGVMQLNIIGNELKLDKQTLIESNYFTKIVSILTDKSINKNKSYVLIRETIINSRVNHFQSLLDYINDNIDMLTNDLTAQSSIILVLAENQVNDSFSVNKEINIMSAMIKIIDILK